MIRRLLELFAPFTVIAKELTAIRELMEADLASREKPVYRVTEAPSKYDTEVTYAGEEPKKNAMARLLFGEEYDPDEDTDDKP